MKPELREHSCRLEIDFIKQWIICTPEDGRDYVVLTTTILYLWHTYISSTEEGIRFCPFIECAGFAGKDMVLKLLGRHKIIFCNCKEIYLYGLILSEQQDERIFLFDQSSTELIQGSPYLYRKTAFISYATADKGIVQDLASRLERTMNIWIDEKNISVGDSITEKIDEGLKNTDVVILCLSENSLNSSWVRKEYSYAMHSGKKVLPIRLDDYPIPPTLADIKYIRYTGNENACVKEIFESAEKGARN